VGRHFTEAPDITARICGICPVAYQMSACLAMEDACGVVVDERIEALRRLLYCGEWIQSHALHIYLLHAPDFLGCADAVELADLDPIGVTRGLDIKRTGNLVMQTVGGRAVHPVNVRVGGFYRSPELDSIRALAEPLRRARDAALETVEWVAGFEFPDVTSEYRFVALDQSDRYAIDGGRPSLDGHTLSAAQFAEIAVEEHVERSTALHAKLDGRDRYLTGPLARFALNASRLPEVARDAAAAAGLYAPCVNPFRSIVVRAVELVFACDEALRLVERYEPPVQPAIEVVARAATGTATTEALEVSCSTSTTSTTTASSAGPESCRRRRRINSASKTTCVELWRTDSPSTMRNCSGAMMPLKRVKSRWQWALIKPGKSVLAPRSVTGSPGWAVSSDAGPIATTSPPSTRTAPRLITGDEIGKTISARYNIEKIPGTQNSDTCIIGHKKCTLSFCHIFHQARHRAGSRPICQPVACISPN